MFCLVQRQKNAVVIAGIFSTFTKAKEDGDRNRSRGIGGNCRIHFIPVASGRVETIEDEAVVFCLVVQSNLCLSEEGSSPFEDIATLSFSPNKLISSTDVVNEAKKNGSAAVFRDKILCDLSAYVLDEGLAIRNARLVRTANRS